MKANAWVAGAAQGSIGFNLSMIVVICGCCLFAMDRYSSWLGVMNFICLHQAEAWGSMLIGDKGLPIVDQAIEDTSKQH